LGASLWSSAPWLQNPAFMDDVFTLEAPFFWRFSIAIFDWLPELSPFLAQENHHPK
jgi:hypothetical protein